MRVSFFFLSPQCIHDKATCIIVTSFKSCSQHHLLLTIKAIASVIIPCNSWLFLLRVRAIPPQLLPRLSVMICTLLWATTLTSFIILPAISVFSVKNQDGTCSFGARFDIKMMSAPFIALVVFDTATVIVITMALVNYVPPETSWSGRLKSVTHTKHLGQLSKTFLRSGQIYYLYAFQHTFRLLPLIFHL